MSGPLSDSLQEKLREDGRRGLSEREAAGADMRSKLRDFAVTLREPGSNQSGGPASTSSPSFKIGDVPKFPYVAEKLPTTPGNGNLSPEGSKEAFAHLKDAASRQDFSSRDAAVGRAAKSIASDWAHQHGLTSNPKESVKAHVLHEARAQAVFISREIGEKLGVGPVTSSAIGYSLERALEKEGFKVLVSHAVDKSVDVFKATTSSAAQSTGLRHSAETNLNKSLQWLSAHGVTPEAFKGALTKHAGAITAVMTLSTNPEVVQRAAHIISHSDKGLDMVTALAKDDQLRKAVGTMTLASGETLAMVNKGAGSAVILAGAALKGESVDDVGRHAFRAAMSVLGGAAGGVSAGMVSAGFGSFAGATAGAAAGSFLADKMLKVYDDHFNGGRSPEVGRTVHKDEVAASASIIAHKMEDKAKDALSNGAGQDRGASMERSMGMKQSG